MREPVTWCGLAVVLGVVTWWAWCPPPGACVACAFLLALLSARTGPAAAVLAAFLVGAAAPGLRPEADGDGNWRGEVIAARAGSVDVRTPSGGVARVRTPGDPGAARGQTVLLRVVEEAPWRSALPGEPDGVRDAAVGRRPVRLRAEDLLALGPARLPPDPFAGARHGGLLRALVTGDRRGVPEATTTLLTRTGTRHLLAISGLHVGLVAGTLAAALGLLLRPLALRYPTGRWRPVVALLATAAACLYGALAGWPVSARRAAAMAGLALLARATGRSARPLPVVAVVAAGVAVADPEAARSAAFGMSFGAVVGVLQLTREAERHLPPDLGRGARLLVGSVAATLGGTLGTLPWAAWVFQHVAPWSVPANLVAVPLIGSVAVPLALLGWLGVPGAVTVADGAVELALRLLTLFDDASWNPAVGPGGALALATVPFLVRRPALAGLVLTLALGLRTFPPPGTLQVTVLAVGQGDATLLELPSGQRVLVDGGPDEDDVLRFLRRRGVIRLDEVIVTHGDADHSGGLASVLATLDVARLRVGRADDPELAPLLSVAAAHGVPVVGVDHPPPRGLEVLWPVPGGELVGNDASVVVRVRHGRSSLLLTGDVEAPAEAALLGQVGPVGWLKVPHHGSATSSTPAAVAEWSPRLAIVTAGPGNRYGHPRLEVLQRYRGARVVRTDRHGTIQLRTDGVTERLRTWRPGPGWSAWEPLRPEDPPPRTTRSGPGPLKPAPSPVVPSTASAARIPLQPRPRAPTR